MSYTPQTWTNGSAGGTPISAARLTVMETGIEDADTRITTIEDAYEKTSGVYSFNPAAMDPTARAMNSANQAIYRRVWGAGTISSVRFRVATQSGNVAVAFYSNTTSGGINIPNARLATTGSVACPATGASTTVALDVSLAVTAGMWVCFVADNTTATFVVNSCFPLGSTENLGDGTCYEEGSAFPPPATATPLAAVRRMPLIRGVA